MVVINSEIEARIVDQMLSRYIDKLEMDAVDTLKYYMTFVDARYSNETEDWVTSDGTFNY